VELQAYQAQVVYQELQDKMVPQVKSELQVFQAQVVFQVHRVSQVNQDKLEHQAK
jgi:hypothetical protein